MKEQETKRKIMLSLRVGMQMNKIERLLDDVRRRVGMACLAICRAMERCWIASGGLMSVSTCTTASLRPAIATRLQSSVRLIVLIALRVACCWLLARAAGWLLCAARWRWSCHGCCCRRRCCFCLRCLLSLHFLHPLAVQQQSTT